MSLARTSRLLLALCAGLALFASSSFVAPDLWTVATAEAASGPGAGKGGVLTYVASPASQGMENRYTLRARGTSLELVDTDSGTLLRSRSLAATLGVDIKGADGDTNDTLTIDFSGGPLSLPEGIRYDGGVGGYDTLVLAGGAADRVTYDQKNSTDGTIFVGGLKVVYSNIEPITDTVAAATLVINGTAAAEIISIVDGPAGQTQVNSTDFEFINFANKTAVTVNGAGGTDTFNLNNPNPATGMTSLTINGGAVNDNFNVIVSPPGVTVNVNGGGGVDTLTVSGVVGVLDNLRHVPTGAGSGSVQNDNATKAAVDSFTGIASLVLQVQAVDGDGVRIDGTGGNDLIQFFHGASAGDGLFQGLMNQNGAAFALTPTTFLGTDPLQNDADVNFFSPGGTDTFEYNGTAGDDVMLVQTGEAGGTEARNTIGGVLWSRLEIFNVATVNVKAGNGSDSITVSPHPAIALNLDGGDGTDTLIAPNATNVWNVTGVDTGNVTSAGVTLVTSYIAIENLAGGTGIDTFNFAGAGAVTGLLDGGAGDDTIVADGNAGALDNLRHVPTGLGKGLIINDNQPTPSVAGFQGIEHIQFNVSSADGDGVRIDGTIGNDLIRFFHGATAGAGSFQGTMDSNNATGGGPFALTETIFAGTDPAANDADVNFFNPGGADTVEFNGTTGNDAIVVGQGEAGGVQVANTIGGTLFSRLEIFNVATVNVNGGAGSDTFNVTPRASVVVNVNGGDPTPPASPGDVLTIVTTGTTTPALSSTSTASGLQGSATFGNRANVNFQQIEGIQAAGMTMATTASASVAAGGNVTDTAALALGLSPTGSVTFRLYGPTDPTCAAAPVFTSAPVAVNGNGNYTSGSFSPLLVGTYQWIASYSGDANNPPITGVCGTTGESVLVTRASPTITTTAAPPFGTLVGTQLFDIGVIAGGANPGGTITFRLYGPNDLTCSGTPVFISSPVPVNGNGSYDSNTFGSATVGSYSWIASYSGDANNNPATHACNLPLESFRVAPFIPTLGTLGLVLLGLTLAAAAGFAVRRRI